MSLIGKPWDWTEDAACRGTEPDVMVPDCELRGPDLHLAKKTCLGCSVQAQCLADALDIDERYGIRGGLSTPERDAYAAGAAIATCRRCGLLYANTEDNGMCRPCTPLALRRTPEPVEGDAPDPRCGSPAGRAVHQRRGERPCDPCLDAERTRNRARTVTRSQRVDVHNVNMAIAGDPPSSLTTAERHEVGRRLLARHLPWDEMCRRMCCGPRQAMRIMAAVRQEDLRVAA